MKPFVLFVIASICVGVSFELSLISDQLVDEILGSVSKDVDERLKISQMRDFTLAAIPGHDRFINSDGVYKIERRNRVLKQASTILAAKTSLTLVEAEKRVLNNRQFTSADVCNETVPDCTSQEASSIFPPIGGRCNNLNNPILGTINRPLRRILPACDRDIIVTRDTLLTSGRVQSQIEESEFRADGEEVALLNSNLTGSCNTGNALPNVRLVSRTFHSDTDVKINRDQFFTMFGQFVCHDMLLTPTQRAVPNCCSNSSLTDFENCLPIITPAGDSFFNTSQCLDFKRSLIFCDKRGEQRRHINQLTAYLDAENIYGNIGSTAETLRTKVGGLMKETNPGRLLPRLSLNGGALRFTAGEGRASENPALTTVHTIFLREHNRMAAMISRAAPSLTDEQIYNQARRIVTAEYQNVIYSEFLPLLLGGKLILPAGNAQTSYSALVDPSVTNEFAGSAFRFGHSTSNGFFSQNSPLDGSSLGGYLLRTSNNNESIYSANPDLGMTSIAKGMTLQAAQKHDNFMTQELTNFLYASNVNNFAFGSDLAARNIQRGRDNGFPGWVHYRRLCTGSELRSWDRRPKDISQENWAKLQTLYQDVGDIDLFTGSLAEEPRKDGTLGLTASCIIRDQFIRAMTGDRYFFTHKGGVGSDFTKKQIKAIRDVTLFDILCLNTNIQNLQGQAFKVANNDDNRMFPCSSARSIDIKLFL